jgi:triacylglycerol esterase/lipase EstA (alpha/beta hydrolase family)
MKKIYTLCITFLCALPLAAQVITTTVIAPPSGLHCDVPVKLNNVVFGAVPPNSENNPVVVFVHGWFDNGYSWFMAKNKWYEDAYNSGYKTAFFFHSVSDAFEDNGRAIAAMIRETCRHYHTDRVMAVCHSKGGYDMEFALYNENMWDTVQGVISLSTPFWGAPMSDMIAIPVIRAFLESVPLVGGVFQGKGSYQMQTAYMAGVVRPMMDNHPDNRPEKFHCFASWGKGHRTVFPANIPDDPIKVLFKDYQPLCTDIPGFGNFASDLITGGLDIIGDLSHLVQVQSKYDNPQKNQQYMDGLAPYYSSIRPGSVVLSEPPPSQQSFLNHMDVLLADNMWPIVRNEIEYFRNHPVLRKAQTGAVMPAAAADFTAHSAMQLIQGNRFSIDTKTSGTLYLAGTYKQQRLNVFDESGQLVQTLPLDFSSQTVFDIFHKIELDLPAAKKFTLESSAPLTGFLDDGNSASMQLRMHPDKKYIAGEPLEFRVALSDWPDGDAATVKGFLNRNMNEKGDVIWDKIIPLTFHFDTESNEFVCSDKLALEDGVYNLSVYAEGNELRRFATSSILIKQERSAPADGQYDLAVFPNPSSGDFTVRFNADKNSTFLVNIIDILGRNIASRKIANVSGVQQLQFSSQGLSKGMYVIMLEDNGKEISSRLVAIN